MGAANSSQAGDSQRASALVELGRVLRPRGLDGGLLVSLHNLRPGPGCHTQARVAVEPVEPGGEGNKPELLPGRMPAAVQRRR